MDQLARYIKMKALADTLDRLSPEERGEFLRLLGSQPTPTDTTSQQLDRIEHAVSRSHFGQGVAQNIVGNAAYDIARRLIVMLLRSVR